MLENGAAIKNCAHIDRTAGQLKVIHPNAVVIPSWKSAIDVDADCAHLLKQFKALIN